MRRLEDLIFIEIGEKRQPDANNYVRFPTEYLAEISEDSYQTNEGVIHLIEKPDEKLKHGDILMFLGKIISEGKM